MWTRERKRPGHIEAGGWRSQSAALTLSRHTLFSHTCFVFGLEKKYSNPVEGHCMKYDACFHPVVQSEVRDTASGVAYCGLGSHRFKSNSSLDVYCIML